MNLISGSALWVALMAMTACTLTEAQYDHAGHTGPKYAGATLVNDITPLPTGYSGSNKLVKAKSHIGDDTAILSYDFDETETIFGQNMSARYHGTDTWTYRNGKWQIVAGQMLRYDEDPAPGKVDIKMCAEYFPARGSKGGISSCATITPK